MPVGTPQYGFIIDPSQLGAITIDYVEHANNLQECELGLQFNGIDCIKEGNTLR